MPNRYVKFVRNYTTENNISWNCAICQIKENNLYKPLNKKQQKEEEKKKDEELSENILLRSINSFKKRYAEIKTYDDFYYVKSAFFNRSKEFQEKVKIKTPKFFEQISADYERDEQQEEEKEKPKTKKDNKLKYIDVLHKILQYFNSNSFSRETIKEVKEIVNNITKEINFSYEPIKSKVSIEKLKKNSLRS